MNLELRDLNNKSLPWASPSDSPSSTHCKIGMSVQSASQDYFKNQSHAFEHLF